MKFLNILLYFGVNFIQLVTAEIDWHCDLVQNHFNVCKQRHILRTVMQLPPRYSKTPVGTHLYIKDTLISSIVQNAFKDLNITELSLEFGNSDLRLESGSFNGLLQVQTLNILSGIVTPTPNLFESMNSLTHLILGLNMRNQNLINSISIFENLMSLKIINTIFPVINYNTFFNTTTTIESLELYNNNISKIDVLAFYTFKSLKTLKIVDDHLVDFEPGVLLGLDSLESLEIAHQPLTVIKKNTFVKLEKLRSLKIMYNMINKIESNAFLGLNLRVLDLSYNAIVIIEKETFYSSNIDRLILSGNPIFAIYKDAFVNCHIIVMYLYNTTLEEINFNFWGISPKNTIVMSNLISGNNSSDTKF